MKNLIKTLFFGYLPLGWKRLFRAITFSWVAVLVVNIIIYSYVREEFTLWIILVIGVSMILSYVISGFIKQKKTP
mgnify:CR=1 FL=1|tara:strand:- start:379 stop:603 length:225 start_codon:yes stop_codon:yes gene_type:complete